MRGKYILLAMALGLTFWVNTGLAQSQVEGLSFRAADINRTHFAYGEPIHLFFVVENTSQQFQAYYPLVRAVTYETTLVNLGTQQVVPQPHAAEVAHARSGAREEYANRPPSTAQGLDQGEVSYVNIQVNEWFEVEPIKEATINPLGNLASSLTTLPEGNYQLSVKYWVLPGDLNSPTILTAEATFRVTEAPQEELSAYVSALRYANQYTNRTLDSYDENDPQSLESFLQKYPNSVYAPAAYTKAMWEVNFKKVRYYGDATAQNRMDEYMNGLDKMPTSDWKAWFLTTLPPLQARQYGDQAMNRMDSQLKALRRAEPVLSDIYLKAAQRYVAKGALKNYAREEN